MADTEQIVDCLFPVHEPVSFQCDRSVTFQAFTIEELQTACSKVKNNKAPGPGNIPPEIMKLVVQKVPEYVLEIYNQLATKGIFPEEWKRARLVLLKKGDKPLGSPSSYRPICLLDIEGKLYEHLLLSRLKGEIERTGGLAKNQYGFREGRQTVDAVKEVMRVAEQAAAYASQHRRLCVAIALDVRNAFNSASWQIILDELRMRNIDEGLIRVMAAYLSERQIILEAENSRKMRKINSGVPQGSVLGPTLWNVMYNGLLELELPRGAELIGFADDVVVVVAAKNEAILTTVANTILQRVSNWMEERGLRLAPEKTEAVLLTTRRKVGPICFDVQKVQIIPSKAIKYLGVWLDMKLTFAEHTKRTVQKAEKTMTALLTLMPNIGGPRPSKRRILASVVHSQLLYAAPTWCKVADNKKLRMKLTRLQRLLCIRICSGYRTISAEAAGVIAGVPPIELMVEERRDRYDGVTKTVTRTFLETKWQKKWEQGVFGRWTWRLIPDIKAWVGRPFGEPDYYLTQALSGHGSFRKYLYDRGRAETDECPYCGGQDDADHTLFRCARWTIQRARFTNETGKTFNPENMMSTLIASEAEWTLTYDVIRNIIEPKEIFMRTNS